MRSHRSAGIPLVAVAGLVVGLAWAPGARASTFVVNSNADDGIGCTFRLAVAAANGGTNGCGHGTASGDIVQLGGPGATFVVLNPSNGPIPVTSTMTIQGNYNGVHPNFNDAVVSGSKQIMQITGGTGTVQYLRFTGVTDSSATGGAILATSGVTLNLNTVQIDHCTANAGGALGSGAASLNISYSSLHDNHAAYGGAIYDNSVNTTVSWTTFTNNGADQSSFAGQGGAVFVNGTGLDKLFLNSTFVQNHGIYGGAMYVMNRVKINASTFESNVANSTGGAFYVTTFFQMFNSTVTGNAASAGGGFFRDWSQNPSAYWVVSRNTVVFNRANGVGGGFYMINGSTGSVGVDNIIYQNTAGSGNGDISVTWGSTATCYNFVTSCVGQPFGCITGDPKLGAYGSIGGSTKLYPLGAGSAALNVGHGPDYSNPYDGSDQRGAPRPTLGYWDMGSYQH